VQPRSMSGRRIVVAVVAAGAALGFVGLMMRGARGPSLPFHPGSLVIVTTTAAPEGDDDPAATRFDFAVAPSSELAANLGALMTGRMPRESGLVRAGDKLSAEVATLAEAAADQGFAARAFIAAGDGVDWRGGGLLRGFKEIDEAGDAELATRAAEWLTARGTAPSFALLHFSGGATAAAAERQLLDRLRERDLLGHTTLVRVHSLANPGWHMPLSLRPPAPILEKRIDERPVSLVDVVPSVCELFGIRLPDGPGPPFLLDPHWRGPRYVLSTSPLKGEFADADELMLCLKGVGWIDRPTRGDPDELDAIVKFEGPGRGQRPDEHDAALVADFRKVVGELFGYRFEEVGLGELLRSQGIEADAAHSKIPVETRVQLARYGAKRAAR
jgi:hypothetical protein